MSGWRRGMPYRAIDPGADPRDEEDHSGEEHDEAGDQYESENDYEPDDGEPDVADYEWDQIETP